MSKWANVLGAVAGIPFTVKEIITYDPTDKFVAGVFIPCDAGTVAGWTYDSVGGFLAPVANYSGNESYFIWDSGTSLYIPDVAKKTALILAISILLNSNADNDITTGLTHSAVLIDLSPRELDFIKMNYELKSTITYPILFKGQVVATHLSLANSTDFDIFYSAMLAHVRGILDGVKTTEATLSAETMANLLVIYDALK